MQNLRVHLLALALLSIPPTLILIGTFFEVGWIWDLFSNVCHQVPSRSFCPSGKYMVVCSRCTGIWFSLPLGELFLILIAPSRRKMVHPIILGLFVLPIALDGLLQEMTVYESTNILRPITGSLLGGVAGFVLGIIINSLTGKERRR